MSLAIIATGIVLAVMINVSSPGKKEKGFKISYPNKETSPNLAFQINRKINQPFPSNPSSNGDSLTDSIARAYLEKILQNNPSGAQKSGDQTQLVIPSNASFEEIMQNYLKTGLVWTRFEISDIKISQDNSPKNKMSYLETLRNILNDRKRTIDAEFGALTKFLENSESAEFEKYVAGVQEQLGKLLALAAPSEIRLFHLQAVNAWQHQLAVYKAILAIKEDPARALLGINDLANMADELSNINLTVQKEYESLKS
ncbi:MAG TPA: hypothetical protein VNK70_02040 [Candidatus Paceibacterota bacterium]|nr:hypothetical protein [Candidatus Paceibacterota bacterium]